MIWRRWRDMASWLADGLPALSKRLLSLFLRALWGLHPEAGPWWPPKLSSLCLYLSIRAVFSCFLPWESSVFYLIFRLFVHVVWMCSFVCRGCHRRFVFSFFVCLFVCSFVWLIVCLIVCSFVVLIVCLLVCLFACLFVFLAFVLFVPSNDCLFAPLFLLPLFLCVVFLVVFWKTVVVIVSLYHFPLNSLQSKDITQMGKRPCLLHGEGCSKYPCELHGFAAGFSCTSVSSLNQKSESATSAIKEQAFEKPLKSL